MVLRGFEILPKIIILIFELSMVDLIKNDKIISKKNILA